MSSLQCSHPFSVVTHSAGYNTGHLSTNSCTKSLFGISIFFAGHQQISFTGDLRYVVDLRVGFIRLVARAYQEWGLNFENIFEKKIDLFNVGNFASANEVQLN